MKLKLSVASLIVVCSASTFAGTLDLTASANASLYPGVANTNSNAGHYTGSGAFGPVNAFASVPDTGAGAVSATESITANILDETTGSVRFVEGWDSTNLANGYANVYGSQADYNFTTTAPIDLTISYLSSFTSSGAGTPAFGLWNQRAVVDGTIFYALPGGWLTPLASGSWIAHIATSGSHTLSLISNSNVSGGLLTESMRLDETLSFSAGSYIAPPPVPEPYSFLAIGAGALGLVAKRKSKIAAI